MNITCLNTNLPSPIRPPDLANHSNTSFHPSFETKSGGLTGLISSSLIQSVFSQNDLRSFLHRLAIEKDLSSDVSEILTYSPISSVLTYIIVVFCLCLFFCISFCILSCLKCRCSSSSSVKLKGRKSFFCVGFLIFIYLLIIADMIYVVVRIDKTDKNLDKTIETFNEQIYPKEISQHLFYLNKQINQLDRYCTEPNSILINASKNIVLETFNRILDEKYFVSKIVNTTNDSDQRFQRLATIVNESSSGFPPAVERLFTTILENHQKLLKSLSDPLKKLCEYEFMTTTDIDLILLDALNDVHLELNRLERFITNDILQEITPWQNHQLIDPDLENDIRKYVHLANSFFLAFCVVVVIVPIGIFLGLFFRNVRQRRSDRSFTETSGYEVPMDPVYPTETHEDEVWEKVSSSPKNSSKRNFCCIRVIFTFMGVIFLLLMIVTGVYYALNLFVQSSCQLVHEDQPFLVSLITDDSKVNSTILNVIEDCRNDVHFSQTFLKDYSQLINETIGDMMKMLNQQIYDGFQKSIGQITIPEDIDQLILFANLTNRADIFLQVEAIDKNLNQIEQILIGINQTTPTVPSNLVQNTTTEFWNYLNDVLESTIDACPLPINTLFQADELVCHHLNQSINGLWLSIFIFVVLVIFGLWIFSLMIYKRYG